MQTSVLGNYFKLKTTLHIISWKFLGLKLRYISQKFKGSLLRFGSGSNLFMTGWTLNWTLGSVQQKFWTLNWTLSSVQEVQVWTLVQNRTSATLFSMGWNNVTLPAFKEYPSVLFFEDSEVSIISYQFALVELTIIPSFSHCAFGFSSCLRQLIHDCGKGPASCIISSRRSAL